MAIYLACAAIGSRGPHPLEDVRSEMSEEDWQRYRERAEARGATAKRIKAPDEGLAVLLDLITAEEERLEGVLAAHLAREEAERMEGPGFGDSQEAERLRRYQLTYNRLLLRILETLRKRRREADASARPGRKGRRSPDAAPSPTDQPSVREGATNKAIAPGASQAEHGPDVTADDGLLTPRQGSGGAPASTDDPSDNEPDSATNERKDPRPDSATNEPKLAPLPARVLTATTRALLLLLSSAGLAAAFLATIVIEHADHRPSSTPHGRESNLPPLRTLRHSSGDVLEMSTSEKHGSRCPGARADLARPPHPLRSPGPIRDARRTGPSPRFRDFPCHAAVL